MHAGRQRIAPRTFMFFCPGLLWGPLSLLLNGHRHFVPGGKGTGVHSNLSPLSSANVKNKSCNSTPP